MQAIFRRFVLDANVFIQAATVEFSPAEQACMESIVGKKHSLPQRIVPLNPAFWALLVHAYAHGQILASVDRVRDELGGREDAVNKWAHKAPRGFFDLAEQPEVVEALDRILNNATESNRYSPGALDDFGNAADSKLIAYAQAFGATVVTLEKRKNDKRSRVSIPAICEREGVACVNTSTMLRMLPEIFGAK